MFLHLQDHSIHSNITFNTCPTPQEKGMERTQNDHSDVAFHQIDQW
jgi:hypothetical protein